MRSPAWTWIVEKKEMRNEEECGMRAWCDELFKNILMRLSAAGNRDACVSFEPDGQLSHHEFGGAHRKCWWTSLVGPPDGSMNWIDQKKAIVPLYSQCGSERSVCITYKSLINYRVLAHQNVHQYVWMFAHPQPAAIEETLTTRNFVTWRWIFTSKWNISNKSEAFS